MSARPGSTGAAGDPTSPRRLDRATIAGAFGLSVFCVALMHFRHANVDPGILAARSLYWLTTVTVSVLALATSMVAAARSARPWVAYALAGAVIVTAAAAATWRSLPTPGRSAPRAATCRPPSSRT